MLISQMIKTGFINQHNNLSMTVDFSWLHNTWFSQLTIWVTFYVLNFACVNVETQNELLQGGKKVIQ